MESYIKLTNNKEFREKMEKNGPKKEASTLFIFAMLCKDVCSFIYMILDHIVFFGKIQLIKSPMFVGMVDW